MQDDIKQSVRKSKNKLKSWKYGYDKDYDIIIISKDGTLGDVVEIQNLKIGLPLQPKSVYHKSNEKKLHSKMAI